MIGVEWIAPVFDRSLEDLASAKQAVQDVKSGKKKTYGELKGCLTSTSLNRIENDLLILAKYLDLGIIAKEWTDFFTNQPTVEDKNRILQNAVLIHDKIVEDYENQLIDPPTDLLNYVDFNALEEFIDLASDIMFHPLRTTDNARMVILDAQTALSVSTYAGSETALAGCLLIDKTTYEKIEHVQDVHYIVYGKNEVHEYINDTCISR